MSRIVFDPLVACSERRLTPCFWLDGDPVTADDDDSATDCMTKFFASITGLQKRLKLVECRSIASSTDGEDEDRQEFPQDKAIY